MSTVVKLDISNHVATITIDRPDKLNALNSQVFSELDSALQGLSGKPEVRCVVVTGSGEKAFAAGADIAELQACDSTTGESFSLVGQRVFSRLEALPIPVIAAVNGFALGGGCELAMACHMRFASETAKFGQPEVNLGILPGYGGTQRLTRLVGHAKAIELCLSGEIVSASQALEIGLINRVYAKEELLSATMAFASLVASKAPLAVRGCLEAIIASFDQTTEAGMKNEAAIFGRVCGTSDFKEGTSAFLEKRPAVFTGS
jgi:enoyl-CoA hydratase